jgi:hypothetical protein
MMPWLSSRCNTFPSAHKKGHGKPIRRLAMTSILKQDTRWCLALPLQLFVSARPGTKFHSNSPYQPLLQRVFSSDV